MLRADRIERPISAVLHDIVGNVQDIVRSELQLAKTELTEQLGKSRSGAVFLWLGGMLLSFSLLLVLLALVYALSVVVAIWAAALIVAGGAALIAALCVAVAVKKFRAVAVPKTATSVKETVEWARQPTR